jgi:excinuclease ABC subunit A
VQDYIRIQGARVHNLKNISLSIPHNQLTVITGVSGSGKSSLAFDTIYAEGQRRYVESLSAYARQFLERMEKPEVDEIDGIAPAVAIRQKNTTRNPRSTVATSTECYDFLRLLFARVGQTFCPTCGTRVLKNSVDEVAGRVLALPEGSRWYVIFPTGKHTGDALRERLNELRKHGFNRLFQKGRLFEFSTPESLLDIDFTQPVYILVDRIAISSDLHQRVIDSTEIAYRESGEVMFEAASGGERLRFSERFQCKTCDLEFAQPEPILFSFNSPFGACRQFQKARAQVPDEDRDLRFDGGGARQARWVYSPVLRPPGKQEVQAACARVPEPLPGLRAMPGVQGRTAPEGGAVRAGRRSEPGRNRADEHRRGAGVFRRAGTGDGRERNRRENPGRDPAAA